ncbi:uncharacterized protein LOC132203730 [Neocloeon triangulifer]|uniref:uncharacterized protein LOC132203730 n=1 Tax=Neocloeon triangulifer TaxID=2078957 RepID=UPI00286F7A47|nr:uncharacterized protein LOC132203730 [Neocloeon triangulifer]
MEVFDHEIGFFENCAPILSANCPKVPIVKCFATNSETGIIYMEDLKVKNFTAMIRCIADLKENVLSMEHIYLVAKTLARFHAASYEIDWVEKFPTVFAEDVMFEKNDGTLMKNFIRQSGEKTLVPLTKHHFQGNERLLKSSLWFTTEEFFQALVDICKPKQKGLNVLCHGDCWVNNMMFKTDPDSGKPLEIKLIDFQLCRFTHGSTDLMDF